MNNLFLMTILVFGALQTLGMNEDTMVYIRSEIETEKNKINELKKELIRMELDRKLNATSKLRSGSEKEKKQNELDVAIGKIKGEIEQLTLSINTNIENYKSLKEINTENCNELKKIEQAQSKKKKKEKSREERAKDPKNWNYMNEGYLGNEYIVDSMNWAITKINKKFNGKQKLDITKDDFEDNFSASHKKIIEACDYVINYFKKNDERYNLIKAQVSQIKKGLEERKEEEEKPNDPKNWNCMNKTAYIGHEKVVYGMNWAIKKINKKQFIGKKSFSITKNDFKHNFDQQYEKIIEACSYIINKFDKNDEGYPLIKAQVSEIKDGVEERYKDLKKHHEGLDKMFKDPSLIDS